jgi:HD superfamily phosphodiesterase
MDLEQIMQSTIDLGQGWGYTHATRVLRLVDIIGVELEYDKNALPFAVYLHDWGAFPKYSQPGVDHALRSRKIAETEILPTTGLSVTAQAVIAEAIELHDYRDKRPHTSVESLLLREADWLDMLGVVGIVREFAWGPNNLQQCYDRALARHIGIQGRLTIPKAQKLAEQRIERMNQMLQLLREESFGIL